MLFCEFSNFFQNNHFVKHLLLFVNQNWRKNCMFITENNVLRKHFTFWLTCVSQKHQDPHFHTFQAINHVSVYCIFFFFAGGKVGALNILIQKIFCYFCRKILIFWASHFHLPLFLLLQFCKISNRYSFWCFCNQLYCMKFSVTIYNFIVRALRTCSLFLNKMK